MTRRQLVLHLLREAGERGVTTSEFLQGGGGSRFGGRIRELRVEGHVIDTDRIRDGAFRYTLTRDAGRDAGTPHAHPASGMAPTPPVDVSLGVAPNVKRPLADDTLSGRERPSTAGQPAAPQPSLLETPPAASYRDADLEAA